MRNVCRFIACAIVCAAVVGCGKVDPDEVITERKAEAAAKQFDKAEAEKIDRLGGPSYLVGKTITSVKKTLDQDYMDMQKDSLIEQALKQRSENLKNGAGKTLTPEEVQSLFAKNDRELQVEINELKDYKKYVDALNNIDKLEEDPLGYLVADKVAIFCNTPQNAFDLVTLKDDSKTYNRELIKKSNTRECRKIAMPKNRTTGSRYEIKEQATIDGMTIYRTGIGWIAVPEVVNLTSEEELDALREQRREQAEKLRQPPAQFYSIFRPLLNISPANPTRIALAEKAIGLIAEEEGVSWEEAAKAFVQQQQRFSRAELECYQTRECTSLKGQARIMAGYVLADAPKEATDDKPLPCEVLAISDCKKAADFTKPDKPADEAQAEPETDEEPAEQEGEEQEELDE